MGPVVIEGSPEALQTVAIPAPITSQIVSDTTVEPDVSLEVADVETDEQTETLNSTIVPTPPTAHILPAASAALALLARDRLPPGRGRPRHLSLLQILQFRRIAVCILLWQ